MIGFMMFWGMTLGMMTMLTPPDKMQRERVRYGKTQGR